MIKLFPSLLALLAMAACASTTEPTKSWVETVDSGLHAYQGEHVHALFDMWGVPDADGEVAGARYYLWERSFESTLVEPRHEEPINISDREARIRKATSGDKVESAFVSTPVSAHCRIRVFVDLWGRIVTWDGRGNEFGCGQLASDMQKAIGDHERLTPPK